MSVIKKIIKNNNEQLLGYWKLTCAPFQNNQTISGSLFVTESKIYFESGYHYLIRELIDINKNNTTIFSDNLLEHWYDYGYIIINKEEIKEITKYTSIIKKAFTIILKDETKYNFSNGIFPINKITKAINNNNINF